MSLMLSCEKKQSSSDQMLNASGVLVGLERYGNIIKDWWHLKCMWDLQCYMVLENHKY